MSLKEGQWQIGDYVFGKGTRSVISTMDQSGYAVQAADSPRLNTDEVHFGKDFFQPGQIQMTVSIMDNYILPSVWDSSDPPPYIESADSLLEKFVREWRADEVRRIWGYIKPLTYRRGGQTRLVYGRPRDIAATPRRDHAGWYDCTVAFQRADTLSYSEQTAVIFMSQSQPYGYISRVGGGGAETWLEFSIVGPIVNPVITIGPYVLTFNYTLPAGKVLQVNSYPWERRAISSEGQGINILSKLIANSPYINELKIPANANWAVNLAGQGMTASTYMLLSWKEAYHAL